MSNLTQLMTWTFIEETVAPPEVEEVLIEGEQSKPHTKRFAMLLLSPKNVLLSPISKE